MTAPSMHAAQALSHITDIAARWAENAEEALPRRLEAADTDEACAALAEESGEFETTDVIEIRDVWRAIDTAHAITSQRGCEGFDPAVTDGKLTTLIDVVVFG
jgi:hypothetical protein